MSGVTATKIMKSFSYLAETLFQQKLDQDSKSEREAQLIRVENATLRQKWKEFHSNLLQMWECIEKRDDFTDNDHMKLHKLTGTFMDHWVGLCQGKHMSNYIHIIGSGRLTYFAKRYGNLYQFSQQGWESLNKLIKHYYYINMNHGGSYGNGGKDENGRYTKTVLSGQHCLPLLRFCQICGWGMVTITLNLVRMWFAMMSW